MVKFKAGAALGALLVLAGCATAKTEPVAAVPPCNGSAEANRRIVLAFYNKGLVGLQPRAAFERYMTPQFVEHKPDVPQGTREATAAFLEQLIANVPQPRWEVVRTIAEGTRCSCMVGSRQQQEPQPMRSPTFSASMTARLRSTGTWLLHRRRNNGTRTRGSSPVCLQSSIVAEPGGKRTRHRACCGRRALA